MTELQSEESDYAIEILGVNWNLGNPAGNELMTDGRDLPWLQDTTMVNVQTAWGAVYRDVVILDAWNRPLDPPFNLTTRDLGDEMNREALKTRLREAAVLVDADGDKIGDDWEERYFLSLNEGVEGDSDNDGEVNLLEYAMASRPDENGSRPVIATGSELLDDELRLTLTFRQRLGAAGGLKYFLEWSATGALWNDVGEGFEILRTKNNYDGSGSEVVTYGALEEREKAGLYRVRVAFE